MRRKTGISRTHRGFWMTTPDGHDVHILGDPKMPKASINALGAMMDAAYKSVLSGKIVVPATKAERKSELAAAINRELQDGKQ